MRLVVWVKARLGEENRGGTAQHRLAIYELVAGRRRGEWHVAAAAAAECETTPSVGIPEASLWREPRIPMPVLMNCSVLFIERLRRKQLAEVLNVGMSVFLLQ